MPKQLLGVHPKRSAKDSAYTSKISSPSNARTASD
jgi:hypothetical protein